MKLRRYIALAVIALFIVFCGFTLTDSLTPYVDFAGAKAARGTVQVRGVPVGGKMESIDNGRGIGFWLRDESGQEAFVIYRGSQPDNLFQAESIVVIGQYEHNQFVAEKLLVKCPSKYQAVKQ